MTKLFIEPCISLLREELKNNINKNKKNDIDKKSDIDKKNKKLENMLLMVQENFHKKEIKQNDEDIVNYKYMIDSKDRDINDIMKEYKEQKAYAPTLHENEEDEINDLDNDDNLNKFGKKDIKESKKTNNLFSNLFQDNKKNNDTEDEIKSKQKYDNNENISNQNKISFQKKNSPKNHLPKVNKK